MKKIPEAKVPISLEIEDQKVKKEQEEKSPHKPSEIEELTKDFWFSR